MAPPPVLWRGVHHGDAGAAGAAGGVGQQANIAAGGRVDQGVVPALLQPGCDTGAHLHERRQLGKEILYRCVATEIKQTRSAQVNLLAGQQGAPAITQHTCGGSYVTDGSGGWAAQEANTAMYVSIAANKSVGMR